MYMMYSSGWNDGYRVGGIGESGSFHCRRRRFIVGLSDMLAGAMCNKCSTINLVTCSGMLL